MKLGSSRCATCGGRGILTGVGGRPSPCVPCSSERREESWRVLGYSVECNGCTAVLTVQDVRALDGLPKMMRIMGALCGACVTELERTCA